jgi:hypothetical protein
VDGSSTKRITFWRTFAMAVTLNLRGDRQRGDVGGDGAARGEQGFDVALGSSQQEAALQRGQQCVHHGAASVSDSPLLVRYRQPASTQEAITSAATWRSSGSVEHSP